MMHSVELMSKGERNETFNESKSYLLSFGGAVFNCEDAKMVIAIRPDTQFGNCTMYRVAIAYCNPTDKFKRKVGGIIAMQRLLWDGEWIKIRRNKWYTYQNQSDVMNEIANDLFEAFNS
jgi:hypothetical protein